MTQTRARIAVSSGLAALALCAAGGGAVAAGLIGSKNIADGSIRSVDIKNATLGSRDIKDGSLASFDFDGSLPSGSPGPPGVPGPTGPTGPAGPAGQPGPAPQDRIVTWSGRFTANGQPATQGALVVSSDTVPPSSRIRGMDISVIGDHSACDSFFAVGVQPEDASPDDTPFALVWADGGQPQWDGLGEALTNPEAPTHLKVVAGCSNGGDPVPVPGFDFTVKFSISQEPEPPTTTFQ